MDKMHGAVMITLEHARELGNGLAAMASEGETVNRMILVTAVDGNLQVEKVRMAPVTTIEITAKGADAELDTLANLLNGMHIDGRVGGVEIGPMGDGPLQYELRRAHGDLPMERVPGQIKLIGRTDRPGGERGLVQRLQAWSAAPGREVVVFLSDAENRTEYRLVDGAYLDTVRWLPDRDGEWRKLDEDTAEPFPN